MPGRSAKRSANDGELGALHATFDVKGERFVNLLDEGSYVPVAGEADEFASCVGPCWAEIGVAVGDDAFS